MKLSKRSSGTFFLFLFLGLLIGTLAWEVFLQIFLPPDTQSLWSVGPVGFDLHALSIWVRINPGSLMGIPAGIILFRRL
ncbi:MAG: hypothetical protein K9L68_02635 [Spirochaetales bacterium]|nr:hypothetical protein [Spirochaetales bacterium]MCF7937473.1 hypothetical protein [Spirochaetales bacterium]